MDTIENKLINLPIIDLGDIYLREIKYEDYNDMYEYGSDSRVTDTLTWKYKNIEDAKIGVQEVFLSRPKRKLPNAYAIIYKSNDKMIGTCDYHTIDWDKKHGEIGYALNHNFWGNGYATLACKALIDFGFNFLGLDKVVISHSVKNIGSQRVIEKSGFIFILEEPHSKTKTINKFYEIKREEYFKSKNNGDIT